MSGRGWLRGRGRAPQGGDEIRDALLAGLWDGIRGWSVDNVNNVAAARRAVEAGAAPEDVATAMQAAAYEAVFSALYLIDSHGPDGSPVGAPGWALVPATENDRGEVVVTSKSAFDALHEDLLMADPRGLEGSDFLS